MQVFIVGTPFETAEALDTKRLNKQIMDAIMGTGKGWFNHPVDKSYKKHLNWLQHYNQCLISYRNGNKQMAKEMSDKAMEHKPNFHTQEYLTQMKRRLYTKNKRHYNQWCELAESNCNLYWSEEEKTFMKYVNGKRIE